MNPDGELLVQTLTVFSLGLILFTLGYFIGKGRGYADAWGKYHDERLAASLPEDDEGDIDHIVVNTEPAEEGQVLAAIKDLADRLERGEPINATRVTRESTPDGPMHTFERVKLWKGGRG